MLDLFESVTARVGARPVEIVPVAEWTIPRTLREALDSVRSQKWSSVRVHPRQRVLAAADAAEGDLVALGHDLDAPGQDLAGVRLLVSRTPV